MRKTVSVRYIKPETICIGDIIRVTVKESDMEVSRVGTVKTRQYLNGGTGHYTESGKELLWTHPAHKTTARVTLIWRKDTAETLQGIGI